NYRKQSVLHRILESCSVEVGKKLVALAGSETLSLRNEIGSTCLHMIDNNKEEILSAALDTIGPSNAKKQSVLYHAVLTCSTELCKKLVQEADSDCLSLRDEDGNTCLHEAVRSDSKIEIVLKAAQTVGWWCLGWQNNKKQTVLYLAVSSCSASAASHLLKMAPAEILRVDGDGNTLLHFASEKHRHSDNEIQEFLSMMNTLVKSGVRLVCENNVGQNCLHSTTMLESGLHAIHAFAGRYRLREIVKPLAKLSELQVPDLLRLTVTMDANKGATCLHFACEAGNKANIRYLLRQGLLLQNVTHSGMSCIDYAYEKGKLDEVLEVAEDCQKGLTMTDLWRLVDPAQRALKLPDRSNSRQLIASIAHESLRVEGPRGDSHSVCDDKPSKRRGSAVSLSEKPPETAVAVAKKRRQPHRLGRIAQSYRTGLVTNRYFDKSEEFLNQKLFSVVSELLVIDVAAFFDKMNILPDLILTRQFELIPACISLLVYLKPKIAQRQGRLEQLKELQGKIICIVVNALDDLYMSASEEERNLLIDYIRGDLRDNNGENPGPMFPCRCADNADRSSFEYITLFDMVEESDCSELIETDCMHNVARKAWHPRPQYTEASGKKKRFTDPFTPKVKFYIHHVAFVIFLAYAAWYILDFKMTFYTVIPDILLSLYAASYTVQEFADFWRRRALKNFYVNKRIIRCPSYFQDAINLFDCFAILFLWIGLFWKWIIFYVVEDSNTTYACQMMLTISFTLWGFRSVAFLSYHERTGPVISMLSSLLILDLLPFLAIVMIIFYVFGVLFFNLLFPVIFSPASEMNGSGYAWKVILQVFTLPFNLLFTTFDTTSLEPSSATVNQTIGKVAHPQGLAWFKNLLLFVFLFLVNIVMVNLLIALFSLRVSRMDSRALGIWRRTYFEMLREYQTLGPLPPPVSFISEIVLPIMRFVRGARVQPTDKSEWWLNESDYPDEYVSFLRFQATRFRRCRPQLSREVTRNRSDFDGLKAHTGNLMDTLQEQLDSRLGAMADRQEETSQRLTGRLDKVEESLAQGVQVREQQQQVPATSDRLSQNLVPEAVIDDKLRALEARLTAELRAATSTVEPGPDAGPDDSRYRKTTSRLRQQRRKIKESAELFQACKSKNFALIDTQKLSKDFSQWAAVTDTNGSTLLHALFQANQSLDDFDLEKFASTVHCLLKAGVDPGQENGCLRNCLLGTELEQKTLKRILHRLSQSDLKPAFGPLQTNSQGLHAVHVFVCRYQLEDLLPELSQLCDLSVNDLVNLCVTSGDLCGATCLHLACQAGQEKNIKFLLDQSLDLTVQTASGQNCVTLACCSGELQALINAAASASMELRDLLVLIDPLESGLPLPEKSVALSRLSLFNGQMVGTSLDRNNEVKLKNDGQNSSSIAQLSAQMRWLLRALELDSPEILRDLIASEFVAADMSPSVISKLQVALLTNGRSLEHFLTNETIRPILIDSQNPSLIDFAIFCSRTNLVSELSMLPQFDIIPKTLYLLIQLRLKIKLRQGKLNQLLGAKTQALNVLVNVLEALYSNGSENERQLLFGYLTASFIDSNGVRGPMFLNPQCLNTRGRRPADSQSEFVSAMELVDIVDSVELFGTECISKLVSKYWKLPPPLPWRHEADDADFSDKPRWLGGNELSPCCSKRGCTIQVKFILASVYCFLFLGFFGWYLMDFGRTLKHMEVDIVMGLCAASHTLQWFNQLATIHELREVLFTTSRRVCRNFTHGLAYVDLIALLLIWTGLVLKMLGQHGHNEQALYASQSVMGASFLFCAFRLVSLYNYFKVTGAKISMFLSLLYKDFWPFFNFAFVIIIAFGIFFTTLLFPIMSSSVTRQPRAIFKHIFVVPMHLMFGDFGKVDFDSCNETRQAGNFECAASSGFVAFSKYLVFLFLIVVNIVLVNLLIALFSMRVAVMDVKCIAIWRRNRYRMLLEYSTVSPLPAPLSSLHYIVMLLNRARRCTATKVNRVATFASEKKQPWWQNRESFADYPEDYKAYLIYQATQLRQCRAKLRRGVERNRSDVDVLGAFVEGELDKATEELAKQAECRHREVQFELIEHREQLNRILEFLTRNRSANAK
uniref:Ion_trans domain-containing protein n=2 Tax=Macrostomum lignano TaxID=282301 RepID=A0A1I8HKT3_9PLAT